MRSLSPHLRLSRTQIGSITHLRIIGALDESFAPEQLLQEAVGHVILDASRIERITSHGIRMWLQLVSRQPPGTLGLSLINAPSVIVDQLNLVEGFQGVTSVLSVLAACRCTGCKTEGVRVIDLNRDPAALAQGQVPDFECLACGMPMRLEDDPKELFSFLRHLRLKRPDPVVERYLQMLRPRAGEGEAAADTNSWKLIVDELTYFKLPSKVNAAVNVRRFGTDIEGRVAYDLGGVRAIEAEGAIRLLEIFKEAAATAEVVLWRMPISVLRIFAKARARPTVTVSTLAVPLECVRCGTVSDEKVDALTYVAEIKSGQPATRECPICGAPATLEIAHDLAGYLRLLKLSAPQPSIEALAHRALGQYLSAATSGTGEIEVPGEVPVMAAGPKLLRRIGRGGMAEVFLAKQTRAKGFEKYVVVKRVLAELAQNPEFVEMLFAEARANARLTHPNIVQIFDVGMEDGVAYIIMEYVRGTDVRRLLRMLKTKNVAIPLEHAMRIIADTSVGLHYAHSYVDPGGVQHPMVHRDVTPHNILISLDGAIKLADFGIAKVHDESGATQIGVLKGKLPYMSPESIAGRELDARHDVFALGVTTFELLTGDLPFGKDAGPATLHAIVNAPPKDPTQLNPNIPPELTALILAALEKDPDNRISSAGEFRDGVEAVMAHYGLSSSPNSVAQFFKAELGEALAEFDPNVSGSAQAATAVGNKPRKITGLLAAQGEGSPLPQQPKTQSQRLVPRAPTQPEQQAPPQPAEPSPAPDSSVRKARPAPKGSDSIWRWLVGAAIAAAISLGGGMMLIQRSEATASGDAAIINIHSGEELYVGGLRNEGAPRFSGSSALVAIAKDGRLLRFGTAQRGQVIDASSLIDAHNLPDNPAPATLTVLNGPQGCTLRVGDQRSPLSSLGVGIASGRVFEVALTCPDRPEMSWRVMAVPSQTVELQLD
jgi:serine/threonine protein kinase